MTELEKLHSQLLELESDANASGVTVLPVRPMLALLCGRRRPRHPDSRQLELPLDGLPGSPA